MPPEKRDFGHLVIDGSTFELSEGIPFVSLDDCVSMPVAKLSADAEATFEGECILNPNAMRKLMGLDAGSNFGAAINNRWHFTCKTPFAVPARPHRKKRIAKKWLKKYGYKYLLEPITLETASLRNKDDMIDIFGMVVR